MNWSKEWRLLVRAWKETPFPVITKVKVFMEIVSNAVAAVIALFTYYILQRVFVVKSINNLWGLTAKKGSTIISKQQFEWISSILIFIIALFVFTYTENVIELFLKKRKEDDIK